MKLKTSEFLKALNTVIGGLKKTSLPSLSCVKLECVKNQLHLTTSSLAQWQSENVECEDPLEEIFCVNMNRLEATIGTAETIEIKSEANALTVKCGHRVSRLSLFPAVEFPVMPDAKAKEVGVNAADLLEGLKAVHGFEHNDSNARPLLSNVHVQGKPKSFICEATEGRNCAQFKKSIICGDFDLMVPAESVGLICNALSRDGAKTKANEKFIQINHDHGFFRCQLSEGQYPDADQILNKKYTELGEITVSELLENLKSLAPFFNDGDPNMIESKINGIGANFLYQSDGDEIKFKIGGRFKSTTQINSNAQALIKCLSQITTEKCQWLYDDTCMCFTAGDLRIISMHLRK